MAVIMRADQPTARCRVCGIQLQFHAKSDVPHSADRNHAFEVETVADFEPGDLTPEQLAKEIFWTTTRAEKLTAGDPVPNEAWDESDRLEARAKACRIELKARVRAVLGIDFDDLEGALS